MGVIIKINKDTNKNILDYQPILNDNLNKRGMSLWMYLMRYPDQQTIELHLKDLKDRGHIDKQQYQQGFKELQEKNFIIPIENESNAYNFYPKPWSRYAVLSEYGF